MMDFDTATEDATQVLEHLRLQAGLRTRRAELPAGRARPVGAIDAERGRSERDLHDRAYGRLVSSAPSLGSLGPKLPADPVAAKPLAREARAAVEAALCEVRELSQGSDRTVLAECGLGAALSDLRDRAASPASLEVPLDHRCAPEVEGAAYFVVSEALTNAIKHAGAGEVQIRASRDAQV
jgi:signal transduction histidine kinase